MIIFVITLFLFSHLKAQSNPIEFEIAEITFEGNNSFSEDELKPILASQESPSGFSQFINSFTPFGESKVLFDSLMIPVDIEQLELFYNINGYFKAKVKSEFTLDRENEEVFLNFFIEEGPSFTFRKFNKYGLESIPAEFVKTVNDEYQIDSTIVYNESLVNRELIFTRDYMRNHGYMLFGYNPPEILIDTVSNKVDVNITFIPGKRYKVNKVSVIKEGPGKEMVDDDLITEIVSIDSGDYYSSYDMVSAQIRLYRTNLFEFASVAEIIGDTVSNKVPVRVNTDVGLMHEFIPELIFNNEDNTFNIGLSFGFSKKNFFGDARLLQLQASAAAKDLSEFLQNPALSDTNIYGYSDLRLILEQPMLFGKLVHTRWENYLTVQKRRQDYNESLIGTKLSFDFELSPDVFLTSLVTYLNYEHSKAIFRDKYILRVLKAELNRIEGIQDFVNVDSLAAELLSEIPPSEKQSTFDNNLIGLNLGSNRTNDVLFPTRGFRISTNFENGNGINFLINKIAGKEIGVPLYYKALVNASYFPPIYKSSVSAFGIKFLGGILHAYDGNKAEIPINQRFTAGGSNSVRGWAARELIPAVSELPSELTIADLESVFFENNLPGGFIIFEGSVESRNRLFGEIGSALFIDYGNVWNNYNEIVLKDIAVAGGFGFRYYSSFIPFRIDFGFKLHDPQDPRPITQKRIFKDNVFQFHFAIGEAF